MTGFIDESDGVHGDESRGGGDVEREQPPRRRDANQRTDEREPARQPERSRTDDDRIDEASDESFPASDPPQQP